MSPRTGPELRFLHLHGLLLLRPAWAGALADEVRAGRLRKAELRKVDGVSFAESPRRADVTAAATAAGFVDSYRGLTFSAR